MAYLNKEDILLNKVRERGNQMKNDLQISQETELEPIVEVASKLDLKEDDLELYGKYKAKINFLESIDQRITLRGI